jgi:hypothetical protein
MKENSCHIQKSKVRGQRGAPFQSPKWTKHTAPESHQTHNQGPLEQTSHYRQNRLKYYARGAKKIACERLPDCSANASFFMHLDTNNALPAIMHKT